MSDNLTSGIFMLKNKKGRAKMRRESKYHVVLYGKNHTYLNHKNFTSYVGAKEWAKVNRDAVEVEIHDRRELLFSGNRSNSLIAKFTKI